MQLTKSQYLYFSINTGTAFCCCFEFSLLSRGRLDSSVGRFESRGRTIPKV